MTDQQTDQLRGFSGTRWYWDDLRQARWLFTDDFCSWHYPRRMEIIYGPIATRLWRGLITPIRDQV